MTNDSSEQGHGGDAGTDEPDVGQTSTEDLGQDDPGDPDEVQANPEPRDDDIASGHLGEPAGPGWSRPDGEG
ncbi:MAG TPA: hypothetical protein VMZ00_10405 [Sporichthya sp.]|nr:hypothetical protein [Sporichthya sp.]